MQVSLDRQPIENVDAVLARYKDLGARFMVSMLWGAYPGTEGLLMDTREVEAARRLGLKVGVHYNLLRRDGVPSIGDAGYVEWFHAYLQKNIQQIGSDFVFFDGCQAPSEYFKTAEFLAWYYNWADRNGKEVWVNDDLGNDRQETGEYGDLVDHEGFTVEGISPKPWINWDILRNDWTCWVNEFGVNKNKGTRWVWEYKKPEDLLLRFIDTVAKGGVWIVQMDNTKQAWQNMDEIGAWLKVNGEAIYGTRPYGEPAPKMVRLPSGPPPKGVPARWMWQFEEAVKVAKAAGPLYFTRKGQDLYAIHWGWPGETLTVPNVRPARGARIRMLGVEGDLAWTQNAGGISIRMPSKRAGKYAFACRIPLGGSE
jgi:alpha-L-fucosidase